MLCTTPRIGRTSNTRTAQNRSAAVMTENLLAEDAIEGIGAFLAKRAPVWKDR
jgi:enoyl-CoA hydratase/carnithine racemase